MRVSSLLRTTFPIAGVLAASLCMNAQKANPEVRTRASQGVPPRLTPGDYQAQAKAGPVTIAADFLGHSVATPDATFTTEEYVAVEAGLYGPGGARLILSPDQFSLRVNGKKSPLASQPYGLIIKSLKDPEWEAAQVSAAAQKSRTSIGTGGQGEDAKPAPPKMSVEEQRAMEQKVKKASLPEGDRALPEAGLLFFQYGGKVKGIRTLELVYTGPAGKATLALQP